MAEDLSDLWDHAWKRYLHLSKRTPADAALIQQLRTPEQLTARIEADHEKFQRFRDKHGKLTSALKKCVYPFQSLSIIAASGISSSPAAPATAVFGAVYFVLGAANGVSEAYDWITELFNKLEDFTARLSEYVDGGLKPHLKAKVIDIFANILDVLAISEKAVKDKRWKKYGAMLFLGKDEEVKGALDRLALLFEGEEKLVAAINFSTTQKIAVKTEKIDEGVTNVHKELLEAKELRRLEQQKALIEKHLQTSAHLKTVRLFEELVDSTLESSGGWLIQDEKFIEWSLRSSSLLAVSGGPGTGKSCLASKAIEHLRSLYPQDSDHPGRTSVAYFFVKEHDQDLRDLGNILKSLVYQIAQVDAVFRSHVAAFLMESDAVLSPSKIWKRLLLEFYKRRDLPNAAIIVLDGLDEAPPDTLRGLFKFFDDLDLDEKPSRLCFAFFARPEIRERINRKLLQSLVILEIGEKNEGDIDLYVRENIRTIVIVREKMRVSKTKKEAHALARTVRKRVMEKADGMFFKVVLIMEQIRDKERISTVLSTIDEVPVQLEAMIAHVFERITQNEDVDLEDLREILLWVAFAKRPLTVAELYAVLKMRTGEAYDALLSRLQGRFASLFKLTGPAVDKNQDSSLEEAEESDDEIDFDSDADGDEDDPDIEGSDNATLVADDLLQAQKDDLSETTLDQFWRTEVRFAHASIRDFVVSTPENRRIKSLPDSVSVDASMAEHHIASISLKAIAEKDAVEARTDIKQRLSGTGTSAAPPTIAYYGAELIVSHLKSIDPTTLKAQNRLDLLDQVCEVFGRESGLRNFLMMAYYGANQIISTLCADPYFVRPLLATCLQDPHMETISEEDRAWIKGAVETPYTFWRPLAQAAAKMWLTKIDEEDHYHINTFKLFLVWIIHAYLGQEAFEQTGKKPKRGYLLFDRDELPVDDPQKLKPIMKFVEMEETAFWHATYAEALYRIASFKEAAEQFKLAVEKKPDYWIAYTSCSDCLARNGDYDEAMSILERTSEAPEEWHTSYDISYDKLSIVTTALARMDYDVAARYSSKAWEAKQTPVTFMMYVRTLFGQHDFPAIVELFQTAQDLKAPSKFLHVTHSFSKCWWELGCALWDQKKSKLMEPFMSEAIEICRKPENGVVGQSWIAVSAKYMYTFYDDPARAIELIEESLPVRPDDMDRTIRYQSEVYLARAIFTEAVTAHKAGNNEQEEHWISKLRKIATAEVPVGKKTDKIIYKMNDAAWYLGLYLRVYAKASEADWRACFKDYIMEALDMLGDDDPSNDELAYCNLQTSFFATGDFTNGLAAAAVPLIAHVNACAAKGIKPFGQSMDRPCTCDGLCESYEVNSRTYKFTFEEIWTCTECLNTDFCESCYGLLKAGKLPMRRCNKDHVLVRVWPVPEEAKGVAADFEGKVIKPKKEWVDGLRKVWA